MVSRFKTRYLESTNSLTDLTNRDILDSSRSDVSTSDEYPLKNSKFEEPRLDLECNETFSTTPLVEVPNSFLPHFIL